MVPSKLKCGIKFDDVIGDLKAETWPAYLSDYQYVAMVCGAIGSYDFAVKPIGLGWTGDRIRRFTVGEFSRSRKIAIDLDDPRGVILLVDDDGTPWDTSSNDKPPFMVVAKAITLGELTKNGDYCRVVEKLELEQHRNRRLSPPPGLSVGRPIVGG